MSASVATRTQPPIVVGLDGSPSSRVALRWAAVLAEMFDAPITVVTAWQLPSTYGFSSPVPHWDPEEDMRHAQEQAIAGTFGDQPPADLVQVLKAGGAAHVLLQASKSALMVVVGSRGHGGFTGLLLGSVSGAVSEHAGCPVLIVHGDRPPPLLPEGFRREAPGPDAG